MRKGYQLGMLKKMRLRPAIVSVLLVTLAHPVIAAEPMRVADARRRIGGALEQAVREKGVAYPPRAVLLRTFKHEGVFEMWIGNDATKPLLLLESVPVCASSGELGPKRKQGDLQVPEGAYLIDRLNPQSSYHLALHIDYPNAVDRAFGRAAGIKDLGGDIMVHGNCVTIGCIPLTDAVIERVYLLVHDARQQGARVPIHVFPRRLDEAGVAALAASSDDAGLQDHWKALTPLYRSFEASRVVPHVTTRGGAYHIKPR
jgi:murein L,D-transpeptidase YafK